MRKCKVCKSTFKPTMPIQAVCGDYDCAIAHGRETRAKAARVALRRRREGLRSKSDWLKLAQTEFNKFIRLRDESMNLPCISCGRYHQGQWHAGHYRPVGGSSGSALRFNEINCHRQCSVCNNFKSGSLTDYRINLIKKIGLPLIEWLEKDHPKPAKWSIEEIQAIRKYYQHAHKELSASREHSEQF